MEKENAKEIPGEVQAAIAMALYVAQDAHDEEDVVLTIKNMSRRSHSPWNAKIFSLREMPRR